MRNWTRSSEDEAALLDETKRSGITGRTEPYAAALCDQMQRDEMEWRNAAKPDEAARPNQAVRNGAAWHCGYATKRQNQLGRNQTSWDREARQDHYRT